MTDYIRREAALEITTRTCEDYAAAFAEIRKLPAADVAPVVRCKDCQNWKRNVGWKVNESAADWGLVFNTLLLIAFLQSDAETPEAAAEKFAKKLLDIPENVDLFAETPEERRARSDKWYAQEWEKIKQEIEEMKISEYTTRPENPALG